MVKFLNKKEICAEESPIMLQRRHTIMEVDKECNLKNPKLKFVTRSSSTSSTNSNRIKEPKEISKSKQADTTLSSGGSVSASNASTLVITESELSSSWLYNNKKAQIKTSPVASNHPSSSRLAEMNDEMRSPILPKSKIRSESVVSGRTRKSPCCCYALIILIIVVATLGILSAIASILYLEFFASNNATDIQIMAVKPVTHDSVPLKKIGHALDKEDQKTLNVTKISGKTSETVHFSDSSTEIGISKGKQKIDIIDENIGIVSVNETDSSNVIIKDDLNVTSELITSATSDQKVNLNPINALFPKNTNLESHYTKLLKLYEGLRSSNSSNEKSSKSDPNKSIPQNTALSTINDQVNDQNSMHLSEEENTNLDRNANSIEKNSFHIVEKNSSELAQDSSIVNEEFTKDVTAIVRTNTESLPVIDEIVNSSSLVSEDTNYLRNQESLKIKTDIDGFENMETFSFKPLPQLPEEDKNENLNLFRTLDINFEDDKISEEKSGVSGEENPLSNLPIIETNRPIFIPNFLSSLGFSNTRNPDENFQNNAHVEQISEDETDSIDLNLPILDTNVAVPKPIEMNKRIGLMDDEKNNQNDLTQQDRQFSLEKALERLRLLDANNLLPSSRQSEKALRNEKEKANFSSNQEVATERSHYLENLRKKLFENE